MKSYFILSLFIFGYVYTMNAQIQESLYVYNDDSIVPQSKYIDPFYLINKNTLQVPFKNYSISSADHAHSYVVKLSNYKEFENDPGYFRIIEIECNNKLIVRVKQTEGWNNLPKKVKDYGSNEHFLIVPLTEYRTALFFFGYPYDSEPPLLTIIVLDKNQAKLVFNKNYIINQIEKSINHFILTLQDEYVEYSKTDVPANTAQLFKIWQENGILKFGGPYGITNN